MGRTNYTSPRYIERAWDMANSEDLDVEEAREMLMAITSSHDALLQMLYRTIDDYSSLLQSYGPHHQVELGEPLSRFENIIRKALNE